MSSNIICYDQWTLTCVMGIGIFSTCRQPGARGIWFAIDTLPHGLTLGCRHTRSKTSLYLGTSLFQRAFGKVNFLGATPIGFLSTMML